METMMALATEPRVGLGALSDAAAGLVERLRPSVVSVRAAYRGGGAGVIWSVHGLIVTNAHVVRQERATVRLDDGRELAATLVARDPARDLAALRVMADGLVAAPIGDSTALRVGQIVVAMGHPFGEPHAVAMGIINRVDGATRLGERRYPETVQADLSLYPGNSGGPLVDAHGRVVGINSMVLPPRLALAVPTATVARFLAPGGRTRLGIRTQRVGLPPPLVQRLRLAQETALIVVEVLSDEPAARAGLLPGDILLGADDLPLRGPVALADLLESWEGQSIRFRVLRSGAVREVDVASSAVP
jgi:serine protease Do